MQIEIASSSALGDKYRWLLGGSTAATDLTTGWNFITRRIDQDFYYAGTFNPLIFKYARLSFEVKTNSSGRIATLQAFGLTLQTTDGSTVCNMFPRYDDNHSGGGYRRAMATYGALPTWGIHRISSTGVGLLNLIGLISSTKSTIYPTWGHSYGEEHVYNGRFNHNNKMEYIVRCKNDEGKLPFVGADISNGFYGTSGRYGVYATSNVLKLTCEVNSTVLTDYNSTVMTIGYNDDFKITLWKEDPPIYNCNVDSAQITALIEKIATTQACTLAYRMDGVVWQKSGLSPVISSCEPNVGAEIMNFKYARR
jgi:hypothetical protein